MTANVHRLNLFALLRDLCDEIPSHQIASFDQFSNHTDASSIAARIVCRNRAAGAPSVTR